MEYDTELIERGLNFAHNGFLKSILSRRVAEISILVIDQSISTRKYTPGPEVLKKLSLPISLIIPF